MVQQSNHYLKWAFIEAANVVVRQRHHSSWRGKYVVRLFERTRQRKGHAVAVGATARYRSPEASRRVHPERSRRIAEATYWILKKDEPYREPISRQPAGSTSAASSKQGQAPAYHGSSEIREPCARMVLIAPPLLNTTLAR